MTHFCKFALAALVSLSLGLLARADEPNLKKYSPPADNAKDEPMAKQFSLDKAVGFLDNAALQWTDKRGCFACHTNYAYLYVRPMVGAKVQAHAEVRQSLENMVTDSWVLGKPRWDAEVIATAAALAYNDSLTTKKLHPLTRLALNRMWTVQRKDGGISWLLCKWPPMENDDHYGVTLAALAVGVAPDGYAKTKQAAKGLAGLRGWLAKNPPQNLHHKAMILWVSTSLDGFMTADEQKAVKKELLAQQLPDGGWSASGIYPWPRADRKEQEPDVSDGYGTGFTIFVLRRAGVAADDPALVKGIAWLKGNQRESGRWFARSLYRDNKHYLSHAGSAFAVMAIQACQ
ncbi:MAG: squalene--hopene cyclase [Gemmataceae bacterium]|nr:squalene--hopene cyclase [Gemmataceae bacterium]